jgi:hypothetical protein
VNRRSETVGLDLKTHLDSGMIHIFYENPQELEIDSHFARIVGTIEKHDIHRLVIDGVSNYKYCDRRSAPTAISFTRWSPTANSG